jgi:hypothetical protein
VQREQKAIKCDTGSWWNRWSSSKLAKTELILVIEPWVVRVQIWWCKFRVAARRRELIPVEKARCSVRDFLVGARSIKL